MALKCIRYPRRDFLSQACGEDQGNDERDEDVTISAMTEAKSPSSGWVFLKRHKGPFALFVVAGALILAEAVYVFWWFTGNAQSTGLVPAGLGGWTMGNLVDFVIYSIFWELLLVGVPVAVGAIAAWMWWRKLPYEERAGYHWGRGKRSAGSGGAGFFFFLAFALKIYLDGNWNTPISSFKLNYVVGSVITILLWAAVIFGIPIAIGMTWWASRMLKKV
jgi:hypothetical protein